MQCTLQDRTDNMKEYSIVDIRFDDNSHVILYRLMLTFVTQPFKMILLSVCVDPRRIRSVRSCVIPCLGHQSDRAVWITWRRKWYKRATIHTSVYTYSPRLVHF